MTAVILAIIMHLTVGGKVENKACPRNFIGSIRNWAAMGKGWPNM